jgi:hypothetical protein
MKFCGGCGAPRSLSAPLVAPPTFGPPNSHAQVLGVRPARSPLGKVSQQTGKRERARDHLTTATTMYREMDMRFWLGQAEAEMGGLA